MKPHNTARVKRHDFWIYDLPGGAESGQVRKRISFNCVISLQQKWRNRTDLQQEISGNDFVWHQSVHVQCKITGDNSDCGIAPRLSAMRHTRPTANSSPFQSRWLWDWRCSFAVVLHRQLFRLLSLSLLQLLKELGYVLLADNLHNAHNSHRSSTGSSAYRIQNYNS